MYATHTHTIKPSMGLCWRVFFTGEFDIISSPFAQYVLGVRAACCCLSVKSIYLSPKPYVRICIHFWLVIYFTFLLFFLFVQLQLQLFSSCLCVFVNRESCSCMRCATRCLISVRAAFVSHHARLSHLPRLNELMWVVSERCVRANEICATNALG